MINRLRMIYQIMTGNHIVLEIKGNTMVVHAGKRQNNELKEAACVFFRKVYIEQPQ